MRNLPILLLFAATGCGGGDPGSGPGPNPVVVTVTPPRDTLTVDDALTLQAVVKGPATSGVTWSLQEGAVAGTVSPTGIYHAGSAPGLYHVIATSTDDPSSADSAAILVVAHPVATITAPDSVLAGIAGSIASVPSQSGSSYQWAIAGGTITSATTTAAIVFTVGAGSPVTLQCTVTNLAGADTLGTALVATVPAPVIVSWFADRTAVTDGQLVTLTGVFEGGPGSVDHGVGPVTSGIGVMTGTIQDAAVTFTLTVRGFRGTTVDSQVTVVPFDPPQVFSFSAIPRSTAIGDTAYLRLLWQNTTGITVTVDQGIGSIHNSVFPTGILTGPTLFTATVRNQADSAVRDTVTAFAEPPAPGSFAAIGSLVTGRYFHTATLLADGRVLITGGVDENGASLNTADILDPATGIIQATGAMTVGRSFGQAVLLSSGKVLVTGGVPGGNGASAELYDPVTGTFTSAGNMVKDRFGHTMTRLQDGRVLIIGGDITSSQAELYDPVTGNFTVTDTMLGARTGFTAILLHTGRVLVVGAGTSTEIYNPVTGQFSSGPNLTLSHNGGTSTQLADGRILVAGGLGPDGIYPESKAEIIDLVAHTVAPAGEMALARLDHVAVLRPDGTVLLVGGGQANVPLAGAAEVYDPVAGRFIPTARMIVPRGRHRAVVLPSGAVLIVGGVTVGGNAMIVERFQ